jgi:hypothetical protein
MFWRRKNKEADWQSALGAPVEAQAEAQAEAVTVTATNAGPPQVQVFGNPSQDQIKQAYDMAERFMNTDLDGDGTIAGGAAQGDVVGQLERLAKLHETGALTDAEFAAQKAKLLGS